MKNVTTNDPCPACGLKRGVLTETGEHLVNLGAMNPSERDTYRAKHPDWREYDWTKVPW